MSDSYLGAIEDSSSKKHVEVKEDYSSEKNVEVKEDSPNEKNVEVKEDSSSVEVMANTFTEPHKSSPPPTNPTSWMTEREQAEYLSRDKSEYDLCTTQLAAWLRAEFKGRIGGGGGGGRRGAGEGGEGGRRRDS